MKGQMNKFKSEIKTSIANVILATKSFIQGAITREEREAVYDAHYDFIEKYAKSMADEARQEALEEVEEYIHRHVIEVDEVQEVIDFIESELKSGGKDE